MHIYSTLRKSTKLFEERYKEWIKKRLIWYNIDRVIICDENLKLKQNKKSAKRDSDFIECDIFKGMESIIREENSSKLQLESNYAEHNISNSLLAKVIADTRVIP